jgi:hypothetical protein
MIFPFICFLHFYCREFSVYFFTQTQDDELRDCGII